MRAFHARAEYQRVTYSPERSMQILINLRRRFALFSTVIIDRDVEEDGRRSVPGVG